MERERCKIDSTKSEIVTRNTQSMERERCKIDCTKSETSPLNNPVSACRAGDAGIEKTSYGFDPSGVAQRGNSRLYGDERTYRIRGIGARVVRKGRKRGQEREILGYAQGHESGRAGCYSYGVVGWGKVVQTPNPLT